MAIRSEGNIPKKHLFNHDQTFSLDERIKHRDELVKKIQEESKTNIKNLIDTPLALAKRDFNSKSVEKVTKSNTEHANLRSGKLNHFASMQEFSDNDEAKWTLKEDFPQYSK